VRSVTSDPVTLGKNPERSREHNRRVVLDVVRRIGPVGRMEIARQAHLTTQAIANIVEELTTEGLLMPAGRLRIGRGQPPIQFAVNPDGAMTIGIEVGADHAKIVVVDLAGKARAKRFKPVERTDPSDIAELLNDEIADFRRTYSTRLLGAGVAKAGPFMTEESSAAGPTTLPEWVAYLSEACGESIAVENDATAAAMGERLFGAASSLSNFCMIYFGVGVGLGIFNEGWPIRGAAGNSGEIGRIPVRPRDGCGFGDLDSQASIYTLRQLLGDAGPGVVDFAWLEELYRTGNPLMASWLDRSASYLSPMVAMVENILDPETIILGGMLPDVMADDLIERLSPLPASVASQRLRSAPRVMRGQTGYYTAALGAAALPLYSAMTPRLETLSRHMMEDQI
jgi:predicted NBD/HSP70 family sugar kinase